MSGIRAMLSLPAFWVVAAVVTALNTAVFYLADGPILLIIAQAWCCGVSSAYAIWTPYRNAVDEYLALLDSQRHR